MKILEVTFASFINSFLIIEHLVMKNIHCLFTITLIGIGKSVSVSELIHVNTFALHNCSE